MPQVDFKATHEVWAHPSKFTKLYRDANFTEPASLQHQWGQSFHDAPVVKQMAEAARKQHVGIMDLKWGHLRKLRCHVLARTMLKRVGSPPVHRQVSLRALPESLGYRKHQQKHP